MLHEITQILVDLLSNGRQAVAIAGWSLAIYLTRKYFLQLINRLPSEDLLISIKKTIDYFPPAERRLALVEAALPAIKYQLEKDHIRLREEIADHKATESRVAVIEALMNNDRRRNN